MASNSSIKESLIPDSSAVAFRIGVSLYGFFVVAVYAAAQYDYLLTAGIERTLFLLLIGVGTFYVLLGGVRLKQEGNREAAQAHAIVHQPGSGSYTSVNYNSLGVAPSGLPASVTFMIGIALLGLSGIMGAALLTPQARTAHDAMSTTILSSIVVLMLLFGSFLMVRSSKKLPRRSAEQDYNEFAKDNEFTLQSTGLDDIADQYKPILAELNTTQARLVSRASGAKLHKITKMLSGTYRDKPFRFVTAYVGKDAQYYGVIELARPPVPEAQILSLLESQGLVFDSVMLAGKLYVMIRGGVPLDRAGSIEIFKLIVSTTCQHSVQRGTLT